MAIVIRQDAEFSPKNNRIVVWLDLGGHDLTLEMKPEEAAELAKTLLDAYSDHEAFINSVTRPNV